MKSNITFRVESELKEDFIKAAVANGTTATALFHEWMRDYINSTNGSTDSSTDTENNSTNNEDSSTDSSTNSTNNEAISTNTDQIKKLTARIDEMEQRVSAQDKAYQSLLDEAQQQRQMMDGVSCQLPSISADVANLPTGTNSSTNNSSTPAEIAGEGQGVARATNPSASIGAGDRLTKAQLADRLGVKQKTIDNNKNGSHFENWSFKKDPIGLAWEWEASSKRFKPIL